MTFRATIPLGRNDLCHCGSGRKYKKCHLAEDERERLSRTKPRFEPPLAIDELLELCRTLPQQIFKGAELERFKAETGPVLDCLERHVEIEAACNALKPYYKEFEEFTQNREALMARAHALFTEEVFSQIWFTGEDVKRAFDAVGNPNRFPQTDDRFVRTLRDAILFIADERKRQKLAMMLLLQIPEFVKAGRYLDALLIEWYALSTGRPEGSNEFLFQMFAKGFEAWASEKKRLEECVLKAVGMDLDQLSNMSFDEIEAWLQAQHADPVVCARLEQLLGKDGNEIADIERTEQIAAELLRREDASGLLLSEEEVGVWLPEVATVCNTISKELGVLPSTDLKEEERQRLGNAIWETIGEMAQAIFTPERIAQLVIQLKSFRDDLDRAGDKPAAAAIMAIISLLKNEPEPGQNLFLLKLCYYSIGALIARTESEQ